MSELSNLQIEVVPDYEALSVSAAQRILTHITQNPRSNLLVPTGTSPEGVYLLLSQEPQEKFSGLSIYNFDEYCEETEGGVYVPLSPDDPRSYHAFMLQHLFSMQPAIKSYFPGAENIQSPGYYDEFISANGGIDLCLNSVGEDGHTFGFNFPGSSFESVTRLVEVNESTKGVNAGLTGHEIPSHALTAGLKTGMQSGEVIVLVSGVRKATILKKILEGEVSEDVPASILRQHSNCTWIIDEAAASELAT